MVSLQLWMRMTLLVAIQSYTNTILCSGYWSNWVSGTENTHSTGSFSTYDDSYITEICVKDSWYIEEIKASFANGNSTGTVGGSSGSWECDSVQDDECYTCINLRLGSQMDALQMVTSTGRKSTFWGGNGGNPTSIIPRDDNDCISQLEFKMKNGGVYYDIIIEIRAYFVTTPMYTPTLAPTHAPSTVSINSPTISPTNAPSMPPTTISSSPTLISNMTPSHYTNFPSITYVQDITETLATVEMETFISDTMTDTSHYRSITSNNTIYVVSIAVSGCVVCVCVIYVVINYKLLTTKRLHKVGSASPDDVHVEEWLETVVKLPQYCHNFIANGFDTMDLVSIINDESELKAIGVDELDHRVQIMTEIAKLKQDEMNNAHIELNEIEKQVKDKTIAAKSKVKQWIKNVVKLPQYYVNFIANGYDTMSLILEINDKSELRAIGINTFGHQMLIITQINALNKQYDIVFEEKLQNRDPPQMIVEMESSEEGDGLYEKGLVEEMTKDLETDIGNDEIDEYDYFIAKDRKHKTIYIN